MLKIGLTGGIGSGKSLVCKIFSTLGIPVFRSDEVSRDLLDHDPEIISKVTSIFGDGIYRDWILDRKKLSAAVFTDRNTLAKLNAIIHPAVQEAFNGWMADCINAPYIIKESAIIFDAPESVCPFRRPFRLYRHSQKTVREDRHASHR